MFGVYTSAPAFLYDEYCLPQVTQPTNLLQRAKDQLRWFSLFLCHLKYIMPRCFNIDLFCTIASQQVQDPSEVPCRKKCTGHHCDDAAA